MARTWMQGHAKFAEPFYDEEEVFASVSLVQKPNTASSRDSTALITKRQPVSRSVGKCSLYFSKCSILMVRRKALTVREFLMNIAARVPHGVTHAVESDPGMCSTGHADHAWNSAA